MLIAKIQKTFLSSPFGADDQEFTVQAWVDSQGNAVSYADLGSDPFAVVIKQAGSTDIVVCDGITQNDDGSATFEVASGKRSILPKSPYTGSSSGSDFQTGAEVIFTNDPYTMSGYARLDEPNEFSVVPTVTADPVSAGDLTRKSYVDSLVLGSLTSIDVIVPGKAGETVAAGDLLYFDQADDEWKKTDADTAASVNDVLLGIAQGSGTNGNAITGGVLLQGVDTHQSGFTEGDTLYASNTAGDISSTPGTTVVAVGIAKSTTEIYFAPRFNIQLTKNEKDAMAGGSTFGTPSSSNKFTTEDFLKIYKFGGDGSDGALAISAGTTTIDCANARVVIKNYTSLSISGTGALAFSNPHDNGTIVIIRVQGNVTLTSSATPMIDMRGMGAASGTDSSNFPFFGKPLKGVGTSTGAGGVAPLNGTTIDASILQALRALPLVPGAGGGTGGAVSVDGGRGGGALLIECGGAWNFMGTGCSRNF